VGRRWYHLPVSSMITKSKIVAHVILGVVFSLTVVLGDTFFRFIGLYGILNFTLYQLIKSESFDRIIEDLSEFLTGIAISPFIYLMMMVLGVVK
jgi:hypothetical protein